MNIYNSYPTGYYVYAYLRSKDSTTAKAGTPYYIGKGCKNRAWSNIRAVSMPANSLYIVIIEQNLTEVGALALERRLIKWYGRKDTGTGILQNKTDGGDGVTNYHKNKPWSEARRAAYEANKNKPRKPVSEETKAKISAAQKGRIISDDLKKAHSERMKGRKNGPRSEETKAKISAANKGRKLPPRSEDAKIKQSISTKGRSSWTKGLTREQIKAGKTMLINSSIQTKINRV